MKKLQVDLEKACKYYANIDRQLRGNKLEVTKLKKELTTTKKKFNDQLEKQLAHEEQMKDKEIKRERVSAKTPKDNNYTKLLAEECKHANVMVQTEQHYGKAKLAYLKKHTLKMCTNTEKTDIHVQMSQNVVHFPNPRGVHLKRVSPTINRWHLLVPILLPDAH
jgi:DNA gyrase/topoisomerase IV subunit A